MISALGVGSGLDLGTILTGLVEAEGSAKRALLDRQEADVQVRLSGYGAVTAAVDDFRASLASLKSLQPSAQFKASSSDSSAPAALTSSVSIWEALLVSVSFLPVLSGTTPSASASNGGGMGSGLSSPPNIPGAEQPASASIITTPIAPRFKPQGPDG
jgi:flagellar capping protein FliD